jgi:hypothetical protein
MSLRFRSNSASNEQLPDDILAERVGFVEEIGAAGLLSPSANLHFLFGFVELRDAERCGVYLLDANLIRDFCRDQSADCGFRNAVFYAAKRI